MATLRSSPSLPIPEKDLYCSICLDLFQRPVILSKCHHVFCRKCFRSCVRVKVCCPVCRRYIDRGERIFPTRANAYEEAMRKQVTKCKSCGKQKKYSTIRIHYRRCLQRREEKLDKVNELPPEEQPSQQDNVDETHQGTP